MHVSLYTNVRGYEIEIVGGLLGCQLRDAQASIRPSGWLIVGHRPITHIIKQERLCMDL